MLIENVCIFVIYILFFCLVFVTAIAVALFIALIVMIGKLENLKNTSLPGR